MNSLIQFLQKRKEESLSFTSMKQEWLHELERFFQQIAAWLEEPQRLNLLRIENSKCDLYEEDLGGYIAPTLLLWFESITGKPLVIRPVARRIVGASGRVDFMFKTKSCTAIRREELWFFAKDRTELAEVTKESFETVIQDLLSSEE